MMRYVNYYYHTLSLAKIFPKIYCNAQAVQQQNNEISKLEKLEYARYIYNHLVSRISINRKTKLIFTNIYGINALNETLFQLLYVDNATSCELLVFSTIPISDISEVHQTIGSLQRYFEKYGSIPHENAVSKACAVWSNHDVCF